MERTLEQIQKEYNELCGHAGHVQFQIGLLDHQVLQINTKLEALNREADAFAQAKTKEPKDEVKTNE